MPDKPSWFANLPHILTQLDQRPATAPPWLTRADIQQLLAVGPRRAQQILQSCPHHRLGNLCVTSPAQFREFLLTAAGTTAAQREILRRRELAQRLATYAAEFERQPPVLVAAPATIANTALDSLPPGIELTPGQLTIRFDSHYALLEKLLALACALGREPSLTAPYTAAFPV